MRKIRATRRPRGTRSPPKNDFSSGRISWVNSYLAAPLEGIGGSGGFQLPNRVPKPPRGVPKGSPKPTGGCRGTLAPAAAPASPGGPGGSGAAGHWGTAATPPRWCSHRTGGGEVGRTHLRPPQTTPGPPKLPHPNPPGTPSPGSPAGPHLDAVHVRPHGPPRQQVQDVRAGPGGAAGRERGGHPEQQRPPRAPPQAPLRLPVPGDGLAGQTAGLTLTFDLRTRP